MSFAKKSASAFLPKMFELGVTIISQYTRQLHAFTVSHQ